LDSTELNQQMQELREKLNRAMRRAEGLRQKSKVLEQQYGDSRTREHNTNQLVMELLERQRELNVMLNRANIMINRTHEAMALTSLEFNEMAKALPEPKKAEWSDRVTRINALFKKTGLQDAEFGDIESLPSPAVSDSLDGEDLKHESEEVFGRKQSIWSRPGVHEPAKVEAEAVSDEEVHAVRSAAEAATAVADDAPAFSQSDDSDQDGDDHLLFGPRRKSWWHKIAG
jgi:hypothetical protein